MDSTQEVDREQVARQLTRDKAEAQMALAQIEALKEKQVPIDKALEVRRAEREACKAELLAAGNQARWQAKARRFDKRLAPLGKRHQELLTEIAHLKKFANQMGDSERLVAGDGPSTKPSFLERARSRWGKPRGTPG